MIEITRVSINKFPDRGDGFVAECTVCFADSLVVHGIKIKQVEDKHFVVMPESKRQGKRVLSNGKRVPWDSVHPTNKEFSDKLNNIILNEYFSMVN